MEKGWLLMTYREQLTGMSQEDEIRLVEKALQEKLDILHSLPQEEAKKYATDNLIKIGVLNQDGTVAELCQAEA